MKTEIKKLPFSKNEILIEISAEEFNDFVDKAVLNLGRDLEIKGFRKGKLPKSLIEAKLGKEKIMIEAADTAINEYYKKAVLENNIEPVSRPEVEVKKMAQGNPFIFSVKVSVLPEIALPDYKSIAAKVKKEKVEVKPQEVTDALKWVQKSRAKFTAKNGPAQKGDFVEIEYYSSQIEGVLNPDSQKDAFILGEGYLIPGFEEELTGMKSGDEKDGVSLTMPENHQAENLRGKKLDFKIKMRSVQLVQIPELNDEFAKSLGNFKNLVMLKKSIEEGVYQEKERLESQRARNLILEKISENLNFEIPEILIEEEKKQMFSRFKNNISDSLKISFEDYLKKIKKTEKEILDSFSQEAEKNVKKFLVLRAIAKREKIDVKESEIEDEINKILKNYPSVGQAKENIDLNKLKDYTKEVISNEKVFKLLEDLALQA